MYLHSKLKIFCKSVGRAIVTNGLYPTKEEIWHKAKHHHDCDYVEEKLASSPGPLSITQLPMLHGKFGGGSGNEARMDAAVMCWYTYHQAPDGPNEL